MIVLTESRKESWNDLQVRQGQSSQETRECMYVNACVHNVRRRRLGVAVQDLFIDIIGKDRKTQPVSVKMLR